LKLFINFKFTISGLYYISDIQLEFSNDEFSFSLKIDAIKIIFGWPRTRLAIEGVKTTFNINKSEFREQKNIMVKIELMMFLLLKKNFQKC